MLRLPRAPPVGSRWLSVRSAGSVQSGRRLGGAEQRASSVRPVVVPSATMSAAWRALPRVPGRAWAPSPSRAGDDAAERCNRLERRLGRGRDRSLPEPPSIPVGATASMPDEFATRTVFAVWRFRAASLCRRAVTRGMRASRRVDPVDARHHGVESRTKRQENARRPPSEAVPLRETVAVPDRRATPSTGSACGT